MRGAGGEGGIKMTKIDWGILYEIHNDSIIIKKKKLTF